MIIDSPIISGSYAASGSLNQFGNVVISGSLTVTGSIIGSASYAATASYATNAGAGAGFPFSGSAQITGSLLITELSGSGVRYLTTDNDGLIVAQTASAAIKSTQAVTSTANQTSFTITNGYTTGLVDVYINGSKLSAAEFTDTSGTVITLATGSNDGDIVEFVKYFPASGVTNNALRQLTTFTASAGQTVFSASYTPGLLDIYYNGSRLSTSDYTANNGTYFTLATASAANDVLDVLVYSYQVGAFSGIGGQGVTNQIAYFNTTSSISGSNSFVISGSNIGVGTSSPSTNLHIAGSNGVIDSVGNLMVMTTNTATQNFGGQLTMGGYYNSSSLFTSFGAISARKENTTNNDPLGYIAFATQTGSLVERMRITSNGNVGIGTTTPTASLHISTTNGVRLQYPGNTGFTQFSTDGTNAYIFSGFDGERVRITSAGNMGIGTASPSNILHVSSSLPRVIADTSTRFSVFNLYYQGAEKGGLILDNQNKLITLEANGDNTYDIRFNAGGSERMRITSAGVVDISNRNLSRGSMPVGSVIQVVSYKLASGFSTTSASDQDTGLKVSITPTSSTSKILVLVSANIRATNSGGNCYASVKLVRGAFDTGTALHNGFAVMGNYNSSDIRGSVSYSYLDSPATTSSTQYVVSMNSQYAATAYIDSTTSPSTITLLEIAQ